MQPVEFSLIREPKTMQVDDPAQRSAQRVLSALRTCKTIGASTAYYAAVGSTFGGLSIYSCLVAEPILFMPNRNLTLITEETIRNGSHGFTIALTLGSAIAGGICGATYGFANGLVQVITQ